MKRRAPGNKRPHTKTALTRHRWVAVAAAGILAIAFCAGASAVAAPAAQARTTTPGRASGAAGTHGVPAALPAHTRRVCAWPPARGDAACLVLQRTNVPGHLGLFPADAAPSGYGPADLHSAYNLPDTTGQGLTVALVDAFDDPNAASDLDVYRSQYGLPACTTASGCFRKVNQEGQESNYPAPDPDWATEESLDIEMVSAICPDCHILLVEADDQTLADLGASVDTAVRLGAKFVSNSYGFPEASAPAADEKYYTHSGVAITAAAGDDGYIDGVISPAGYPQVTAVGGTSLEHASNPRGWAEIVWTGSGSGCTSYARPSWQSGTGCSNRMDNDVSAVADPGTGVAIYDTYGEPGWGVVGGTSVSSPIIASVYALGGRPAPGTNPAAYPYAQGSDGAGSGFNDITTGTNYLEGSCTPALWCNGEPGYDGPSGWGTPDGVGAFQSPLDYVALGDSYASGEGNPPYYPGTDTRKDQCHRSLVGYPALVTWPGQPLPIAQQAGEGGNDKFTFVACSGAISPNVAPEAAFDDPKVEGEAEWNAKGITVWKPPAVAPEPEGFQVNSPGLSSATSLVTLSIGGNDARFSSVLGACVIWAKLTKFKTCNNKGYVMRQPKAGLPIGPKDPKPLVDFEPTVIAATTAHLEATYNQIHTKAPNAEIVVTGYPQLFPANTTKSCTVGLKFSLSADVQNWLNTLGTDLNNAVSAAVTSVRDKGADIKFINPTADFSGHEICSAQPWIYGLVGTVPVGKLRVVSPGSFHPTQEGQQALAKLVNGCLKGSEPC